MTTTAVRVPVAELRAGDVVEVVENTDCKVAVRFVTSKPETCQVRIAGTILTGERKGEAVCFTCMDQETALTERNGLPLTRGWAERMRKHNNNARGRLS
ncbi:hypothetical protein [Mycobacterium sp. D16R24]|uniref:hypothetical protein n=1 Tax=Mycobacterium sp. D16R24 TaxID=1855656 RepID=UPI00111756CE|nr:hypothetical protein [Mycobacterium sp. D16R24]